MHGVHEKENGAIRRASPVVRHRADQGDTRPFSAYDMNSMESLNVRPRKTGESVSRHLADHGSMSHLRSIYGGRPQKLSGTLSSSKRTDQTDVDRIELNKNHGHSSDRGTVAELIRRFRMTPPAPREERNSIDYWWRGSSDGKSSDTSAEIHHADIESKPSRRRAASAQSSHRDAPPNLSAIKKRPLSANSMPMCGSLKATEPHRDAVKSAYEYDAEIDQRLKGAEHLLSDWKQKQKSSESSSFKNMDAKRQISATVSILKQKYGIPTTSESSDTGVSDSESFSEPKKRYPQRLRMIVTRDVSASSSVDDATIPVNFREENHSEQLLSERASQQSSFPEEHAPHTSSSSSSNSSRVVGDPPAYADARPMASVAVVTKSVEEQGNMHVASDWAELDQCVYPVGPVKRINYRPLDNWLESNDQDCFLSCWVLSPRADDCRATSSEVSELSEDVDDPIAQMLKAREKALRAALSVLDSA